MDDPFIREHIEDLLHNLRIEVLIKLIQPYTKIKISFISGELNIKQSDAESLLVSCILDAKIYGRIDQVNGILELDGEPKMTSRNLALENWNKQLLRLQGKIMINKMT